MVRHETHESIHMNIPHHKLKKLASGHIVQLTHEEIQHGPHHLHLHHLHTKRIHHARIHHKGLRLGPLTEHEIMKSGSLWDLVKKGAKWLGTQALNGIQAGASAAVPELAPVFSGIRSGVQNLTGLGLKHASHMKGSASMKERMAKVRAAKKHKAGNLGGSFLLR